MTLYRQFTLAKTDAENCHTYPCVQTDSGQLTSAFVAHWGNGRSTTYLCLDCTKSMHKNWNITVSFTIHEDFDCVWAEHYPVTLS